MKNAPAVISIEGLYLLASPKEFSKYDEQSELKRAQNTKQKRLALAEMLQTSDSSSEANNSSSNDTFTGRLIARLLNNLQIFIKSVHMRYEDNISNPSSPFSFGITLQSFEAETTNDNWVPAFLEHNVELVHKLVQLKNFSVYCDTGKHFKPIQYQDNTEMCKILKSMVCLNQKLTRNYFFLTFFFN